MNKSSFTIYYDGLCPLCSREINHYKKVDTKKTISFIDISKPSFNAKEIGLDPISVNKKFHIKNTKGEFLVGVDGFIAIWEHLNIFKTLKYLATSKVGRPFFDLGYNVFAFIRPVFRNKECQTDKCST